MTTLAQPIRQTNVRKLTALIVWWGSVYTTLLFLVSLGTPVSSITVIFAAIIQASLTALESSVWRGRPDALAFLTLVFDALVNAAGIWSQVKRLPQTQLWAMLVDVGAPQTLSMGALFVFAVAVGIVLAYAPEAIWNGGGNRNV